MILALREEPIAISTERVMSGPLRVTLDEEGRTRVVERYIVLAPLDGLLHRIDFEPGDAVEGGRTVLATVEPLAPGLLDARSVAMAEARLAAATAATERANTRIATADAILQSTELDLQRRQDAARAVSRQELEAVRREVLFRRGELDGARADERIAHEDTRVARAALLLARPGGDGTPPDTSTADGVRLEVRAPVDGKVLRVMRKSEGPVRIGDALLEIGDTARLEVVADYLSSEAVLVRAGMEAWIEDWGGDSPIAARVRRVEPAARTKVSSLGVEEQRVDVVLDLVQLPPDAAALADGFRVTVRVVAWEQSEVLRVPEAALVRTAKRWSVFLRVGDRVRLTPVEIGHRDGSHAEVLDGLADEDEVVSYPSDRLVDGARVRLREQT